MFPILNLGLILGNSLKLFHAPEVGLIFKIFFFLSLPFFYSIDWNKSQNYSLSFSILKATKLQTKYNLFKQFFLLQKRILQYGKWFRMYTSLTIHYEIENRVLFYSIKLLTETRYECSRCVPSDKSKVYQCNFLTLSLDLNLVLEALWLQERP